MRKRWLRWLGWGATSASLIILLAILWASAPYLNGIDWNRLVVPLLIGLILYGASLGIQMLAWVNLVSHLTRLSWGWWDIGVYSTTHLMKRLPGAPWYIAGRALIYRDRGRGGRAAFLVSLVEWAGLFAAAGIWFAVGTWGAIGIAGIIIMAGAVLSLWNQVRRKIKWSEKWELLAHLSSTQLLFVSSVYVVAWLFGGLILYMVTMPINEDAIANVLDATSVWAVGGGLSMLAVIAPSGLGVREMTLTALLQPRMGLGLSVVVAILIRVLFTIGDLVWGGCFWLFAHYKS